MAGKWKKMEVREETADTLKGRGDDGDFILRSRAASSPASKGWSRVNRNIFFRFLTVAAQKRLLSRAGQQGKPRGIAKRIFDRPSQPVRIRPHILDEPVGTAPRAARTGDSLRADRT